MSKSVEALLSYRVKNIKIIKAYDISAADRISKQGGNDLVDTLVRDFKRTHNRSPNPGEAQQIVHAVLITNMMQFEVQKIETWREPGYVFESFDKSLSFQLEPISGPVG